jgi:hypothetical protein
MDPHLLTKTGSYLVPLLVIALVLWRLIRNPPRKVKVGRLFILPALITAAAVFTVAQTGFPPAIWLAGYSLAGVLGGGAGYLSARHREFTFDSETGEITSRATPIGTIIFAALFAARFGLRLLFPELAGASAGITTDQTASAHHLIGWTEAGLLFSTAMVIATAATTWFRTRPLATRPQPIAPH